MPFMVDLRLCVYPISGLDVSQIWVDDTVRLDEGPILVSRLNNDFLLVNEGRYRVIRALLHGDAKIEAEWLEDHEANKEAVRVGNAIRKQLSESPSIRILDAESGQLHDSWVISKAPCGNSGDHITHTFMRRNGEEMIEEICGGLPR